jgi:hypothetical protein
LLDSLFYIPSYIKDLTAKVVCCKFGSMLTILIMLLVLAVVILLLGLLEQQPLHQLQERILVLQHLSLLSQLHILELWVPPG